MKGYYGEGRRWLESALGKDWGAAAGARAKALEGVGYLALRQVDLDRAQTAAEEGLKLTTEAGLGDVVVADFQNLLGEVASHRGDFERATELFEEGLALNREAKNTLGMVSSLGGLANVSSGRGDHEQAKELNEVGLALCRELGGAELLGASLINLGYEYLLEGDHERATVLNEEAIALYRKRGNKSSLQAALDNLGWAALLRGDDDRAEDLHRESLALCRELGDKLIASESLEGLGCAAATKGEAGRAARLFGAAAALRAAAGLQQVPEEQALRQPYLEAALSQLDSASWETAFTEGRTMSLEQVVDYALAKDETDPPATPAAEERSGGEPADELTRREREVAALVALGLTNRRTAAELHISEHTAATHVRKILKKLGLHSRSELTAWVTERRLRSPDPA